MISFVAIFRYLIRIGLLKAKGLKLGKKSYILTGYGHFGLNPGQVQIGDNCIITADVIFNTGRLGLPYPRKREREDYHSGGNIIIRDNCFIGIGAILCPGVTIGPNSIVGAGSVVVDDVPPDTVVSGNPARFVCSIEKYAKFSENSIIHHYRLLQQAGKSKRDILCEFFNIV